MASIRKHGNRWFAQVKRGGVRRSKSFGTKNAATTWATRTEADLDTQIAKGFAPAKTTVAALIDRYVAEVKPIKTWGRSKDDSLRKLRAGLGSKQAASLTAADVISFAQTRAQSGAGAVTISAEVGYLGGLLKLSRAVWRLDVPAQVVAEAREGLKLLGLVGKSQQRDRLATDDELGAVRASWASAIPVEIIDFAIASCMRLSEIEPAAKDRARCYSSASALKL